MREPQIHSHITDALPEDHPLADQSVYCDEENCGEMLHAFNNECMQTWVETGVGNFCALHFLRLWDDVLENNLGLEDFS